MRLLVATTLSLVALLPSTGVATATPAPIPVLQQDVDAVRAAGAPVVLLRITRNGVVTRYRAGTTALDTNWRYSKTNYLVAGLLITANGPSGQVGETLLEDALCR